MLDSKKIDQAPVRRQHSAGVRDAKVTTDVVLSTNIRGVWAAIELGPTHGGSILDSTLGSALKE